MRKWTKKHARFVGRVIFANFLKLPLERYKNIIEEVEQSICCEGGDGGTVTVRRLSKANRSSPAAPPLLRWRTSTTSAGKEVIAEIVKSAEGFSVRYVYEGFNKIYTIRETLHSKLFYKLRRISSRNELTHRLIEGIIEHQKKFLTTGDPIDLVPFNQVQLQIDNSWTSRLVNRISVITPSGEEKPLKWFFQTQRDINKRLIKQLLDKENEDIESEKLKKPYTDNELRMLLEALLREKSEQRNTQYASRTTNFLLSRHSIGHCRKDMGIPPAGRRLSGYKYPPLSANFSMLYPLVLEEVLRNAPSSSGIYEFRQKGKEINYPNGKTQVIYIGSTRNIRKRLREHLGKNSKNGHIKNFLKRFGCSFRYIQFSKGSEQEERRLYDLFKSTYGASPKCNKVRPGGGL